jgi:hypothetical protein
LPVHAYTIRSGSTSKSILVHARDPDGRLPGVTGLGPATPGATAAFVREHDASATEVRLRDGVPGRWAPGSLAEIDRDRMPGVYQFGAPDELFAPGAARAVLMLTFQGAMVDPVEIDLVAFDPQEPTRLGLTALGPEGRVRALRGAFPRLSQRELEDLTGRRESR